MEFDITEKYQSAKEAYQAKQYDNAVQKFSALVFYLLLNDVDGINIDDCMESAIESYRKMGNHAVVNKIHEKFKNNLIDQYFHVIRHYLDHRIEKDDEKIQEEITREIPLDVPEAKYFLFEEGMVSQDQKKIGPYDTSVATAQGPREEMEDTYLMDEIEVLINGTYQLQLFGVFDGHGGSQCAEYVRDNLSEVIRQEIQKLESLSDTDLYNALTRAFILLNDLWASDPLHQSPHENDSGTTATVAIIISQKALWVANVGDSRAVLGQDGLAIQLSEDAKPTLEKYYYEILYRGGNILWGRVDGNLDMARSVGDVNHPSVSARPTIKKFDLGKLPKNKQNLLIIACDGLWSVVDPQMAIDAIKGKSATEAAEHLKILAYTKGSWDNVTIMTVDLSSS